MGDQPVARLLYTQDNTNRKNAGIPTPREGFEPTIPVFEREKAFRALDFGHCDRRLHHFISNIMYSKESNRQAERREMLMLQMVSKVKLSLYLTN
jgi:hypothetical protein